MVLAPLLFSFKSGLPPLMERSFDTDTNQSPLHLLTAIWRGLSRDGCSQPIVRWGGPWQGGSKYSYAHLEGHGKKQLERQRILRQNKSEENVCVFLFSFIFFFDFFI